MRKKDKKVWECVVLRPELYPSRDLSGVLHLLCRMAGFRVVEPVHVPRTLIDLASKMTTEESRNAALCCATKAGKSYVFTLRHSGGAYESSLRVTTVAESVGDQETAAAEMSGALRRLAEAAVRG